jgi:ribose transport system permease protein
MATEAISSNPVLRLGRHVTWILVLATLLGFALVDQNVLTARNLRNILIQTSYTTIFACAQMFVILVRGFDLSLGAGVSLISVVVALVTTAVLGDGSAGLAVAAGIGAALAAGFALGLFNGACTAWLGVNPFVVTLGSMNIAFGLASTISGGRPVFGVPDEFSDLFYGELAGVPIPILIAAAVCLVSHWLLSSTVYGRSVYLIGTNERAAYVAGVPTRRFLVTTYVIASLLVALGAMMLTARTGSGEPSLGASLLLPSIAAAVIGGLSLQGGSGGVINALLGALFISVLSNGMNLIEVNGYLQDIVLGLVILGVLYLDRFRRGRA